MIAIDTNILIYSVRSESEWFASAARCVESLWGGDRPWMLPWPCIHEYFCVITHPKIHKPPTPHAIALAQIDQWLDSPSVVLGVEGHSYWAVLRPLLTNGKTVGPVTYDARIAAICLQARVDVLWTADRDFSRYPTLHCENPLVRRK